MAPSAQIALIGGLDIGNGYVKGVIENYGSKVADIIDIPSGVSLLNVENKLPHDDSEALEVVQGEGDLSLYNQLDASFDSPLVAKQYRRLFGKRALSAPGTFEQFDVLSKQSKADQELSKILVLGLFAAKAAKDYITLSGGVVPSEPLHVSVVAMLALPITEYIDHRVSYARSFTESEHTVTLHLFETPITVVLHFAGVDVLPEGMSAQFAITDKGEPFAAGMLHDVRQYTDAYEGITPADIVAATNTVGVDIGEGTVNFPIFTESRFNRDSSTSIPVGYGSVLSEAMEAMENDKVGRSFKSRKQLADFLNKTPSAMLRGTYDVTKKYVDRQAELFTDEVVREFGRVMTTGGIGAFTEVIYVYGGGAGAVKDMLYPKLLAKVKEVNGGDGAVVLYLDSRYSRNLNREGLFIAAKKLSDALSSQS